MASPSPKHQHICPEAERAFMEFCGIRTFLSRVLDNETQPDDDVHAFFARLHEEIPFYIAYRFFPELRATDATVDELLADDRVPNPIYYDFLDIMQELMAEGLPTNPFSAETWAELKDALEGQERPVVPDAMSESGDPEPEPAPPGPLGLVPPTGKWSTADQADFEVAKLSDVDDSADEADLDVVKLIELGDRAVGEVSSSPDERHVPDNDEQNELEEPSNTENPSAGLYDSSDEDTIDPSQAPLPKLEITNSGATAIALSPTDAHSSDSPHPYTFQSLRNAAIPSSPSHAPRPEDPSEPSAPDSALAPRNSIELLNQQVSALDLQLAHMQIQCTADLERMQRLERQMRDLIFEHQRSQRMSTRSVFDAGRGGGVPSVRRAEALGAARARRDRRDALSLGLRRSRAGSGVVGEPAEDGARGVVVVGLGGEVGAGARGDGTEGRVPEIGGEGENREG
ncbi:hypothetical protein MMC11_003576 [Xylographa trunciseda]|nr:hypothetical protein [Xylographa trunciseda]